ncbi:OmpA family protein [Acinetobacter sp. A3.8]|uniref:OmpA family protein n=1 Tax=Acinetobacter sedimenti TaxID=2919922 RepID=A0A9X1WY63_9GAMM|nr:OmpA family protein [Acinetobacter sedimenti]MCJ8146027.1 OmpA family protein [Acinetobacter sedimenti]
MKMNQLAVAVLLTAPFALANAGVTVTPMVGYTFQDTQSNNGGGDGNLTNLAEIQDDVFVGGALGLELTPWLAFEAEYTQVKGDLEAWGVPIDGAEYKQSQINGNFYILSDLLTGNYESSFKPYLLLGAGHYKYEFEGIPDWYLGRVGRGMTEEGTLGNAGIGAFYRLNDALSLRTEARATYNADEEFWNYTALAGLQVVLGGHLKPAAPVVEVEPVPEPAPVVVQPEPEQPQEIIEDLKMELRVFFDINKSNIKPQYKPEIAKVAEKLAEYPNATAQIEGHTDNTGPRKLNERLSLARADSVKSALVNEFGVDANRLSTQGFAWDQPIADNATVEGRAMNRRVFATITGSRTIMVQPGQ